MTSQEIAAGRGQFVQVLGGASGEVEEEHIDWLETQLRLIDAVGLQNLQSQIRSEG